jgi:16S rRNA (guanine(1405)-N(7))-methyltransferase
MEDKLIELIKKIKEKRELADIPDSFVEESVLESIKHYKKLVSLKDERIIVKEVRKNLRRNIGSFQISPNKKEKYGALKDYDMLIKTHSSTKERYDDYKDLIKKLRDWNVKKILDLGCGLNPLALAKHFENYYAADIKENEINIINNYFKENNIKGFAKVYDINKIENGIFPKADICLLFKVLDIISNKKKEITRKIIESVNCRLALVSFPTKTLSGKRMGVVKRKWFEDLIKEMGLYNETFSIENEIFYIVKLSKH